MNFSMDSRMIITQRANKNIALVNPPIISALAHPNVLSAFITCSWFDLLATFRATLK